MPPNVNISIPYSGNAGNRGLARPKKRNPTNGWHLPVVSRDNAIARMEAQSNMAKPSILQRLRTKQIDVATAARRLTAGPGRIPELVEDKDTVVQFVKRQLRNTRKQVAKKAERFLRARVATHDAG